MPEKSTPQTVLDSRRGLLAWHEDRISAGPLEAVNNNIKTVKKQAHGFRDTEFFKRKMMARHETQYALAG